MRQSEPCSTRPKETRDDGKFAIDHEWIEREMGKPGVTMTLLWSEYCVKATDHGADPFMYSAFCQRHRKWAQRNPHHLAYRPSPGRGDAGRLGWQVPGVLRPDTGEIRKAHVFVACLPYSSMIFAWPYPNMGEESWIDGHIRAFREFGGHDAHRRAGQLQDRRHQEHGRGARRQ